MAFAGGSGLNVLVVVNQSSSNSVALGNYYCEQRSVPPENLLRINWGGNNINWTLDDFDTVLRLPLESAISSRQLSNQIDYVVLCMDIPYRVTSTATGVPNNNNATTSTLFYGFKNNPVDPYAQCSLAEGSTNLYAGSEGIFRQNPPISANSNAWLTFLLTDTNLAKAKELVDRGVASDETFPLEKVYLTKSTDSARNVRYLEADNAIMDAVLDGDTEVVLTNASNLSGLGPMSGAQTGLLSVNIGNPPVSPGAMMDNLTSFGGFLFEAAGHTTALDFIHAGATASYGTIIEPCGYPDKFPSAQNYFYQARGFSIAESYYQSLTNPYQGVLVGEPLAAPFAVFPSGDWVGLPENALLIGVTNLALQLTAASPTRPVQEVQLFLDGKYLYSVSNLPPRTLNNLQVVLNGIGTTYVVPPNATIASVANGLANQLNSFSYSNQTKVMAMAHGDRVELQSLDLLIPGNGVTVSATASKGSATLLATQLRVSQSNFINTPARGYREHYVWGQVVVGDYLRMLVMRTNGNATLVAVTNNSVTGNLLLDMQNLAQSLVSAINSNPNLSGPDGVVAEDLQIFPYYGDALALFRVRARAVGWRESQVQSQFTGTFNFFPATVGSFTDNLNDLRPRNHLYVTAGFTNWNLTVPFNTASNADGYHELTAVAYEGSHVRTQKRISRNVRIQNNTWSATLTTLVGGTNTAIEAKLRFSVSASTNNISRIELFSTGGLLGSVAGVNSATIVVNANYLGVGLHPFYAIVTRSGGQQYRTATQWLRVIADQPDFRISVLDAAPTLSWPALAGRAYQVLSATNPDGSFDPRASVVPTNSLGIWSETDGTSLKRFYRVRTP